MNGKTTPEPVVIIGKLTVQHNSISQPILEGIDLTMNSGSITICSGRVGTGKTTLARAIIGEVPSSSGSVSVSTKCIGLCTQVPWLPSTSVKEVILGGSSKSDDNTQWYDIVIHACGLQIDLETFAEKGMTQIGSRGLNLSGGQRQRLVCSPNLPSIDVTFLMTKKRLSPVLFMLDAKFLS